MQDFRDVLERDNEPMIQAERHALVTVLQRVDLLQAFNRRDASQSSEALLTRIIDHLRSSNGEKMRLPFLRLFNDMLSPPTIAREGTALSQRELVKHFENGIEEVLERKADERVEIQNELNKCGLTNLLVDLMLLAAREDNALPTVEYNETVSLCVALLDGGNRDVQAALYERVRTPEVEVPFFKALVIRIEESMEELDVYGMSRNYTDRYRHTRNSPQDGDFKVIQNIMRLAQLMCEHHHNDLQNLMRRNNIVQLTQDYMDCLCLTPSGTYSVQGCLSQEARLGLLNQCIISLTEFCQGPNKDNQLCVATHDAHTFELAHGVLSMERSFGVNAAERAEAALNLKRNFVTFLLSLLESRQTDVVAEKLIISMDTLQLLKTLKSAHRQLLAYSDVGQHISPLALEVSSSTYILLHQLSGANAALASQLDQPDPTIQQLRANTGSVEIVREGQLQVLYYSKPAVCKYLTDESRLDVEINTARDDQGSKVPDFFSRVDGLYHEMLWQNLLRSQERLYWFTQHMMQWKQVSFLLTLMINVLIAATYPFDWEESWFDTISAGLIFALGLVQIASALVILVSYFGNYGLLLLRKGHLWEDLLPVYYVGYFLCCMLAVFVNPLFHAPLLFDVVVRDDTLRNVIRSVTRNGKSIFMTAVFGLIIIYMFSVIGFLILRDDFLVEVNGDDERSCDSLIMCLVTTLNLGLRNGGGIGDVLKQKSVSEPLFVTRVIFDLSFFFIVIIIVLNLIFGVIIDTFADLRAEKNEKEENRRNTCFICGLDRSAFENRSTTFEMHTQSEHNLWHYLYFIVHLRCKDPTEYTGPETYVADLIASENLEWFPRLRTLSLDESPDTNERAELGKLRLQLESSQSVTVMLTRQLEMLRIELAERQRHLARQTLRTFMTRRHTESSAH